MLAAFGFFYNAVKQRLDDASTADISPANTDAADEARDDIRAGIRISRALGLVALIIFVLLCPHLVQEVEAAIDVRFALSAYSTLDAMFVVLALGWLGIAILLGCQTVDLSRKLEHVANAKAGLERQVGT